MANFEDQKHQASIFFVAANDHDGIQLVGTTTDTDEPVSLNINSKKYDASSRKWVDDEEKYAKAEEILQKLGATSVETAEDDLSALIEANGDLVIDEIYVKDEVASFDPIRNFSGTEWTKLDAKIVKELKKYKNEVVETLPFEEFEGYRFNIGAEVGGHNVRVSQFVFADEDGEVDDEQDAISLKYTNKQIDTLREKIKEGKVEGVTAERLQKNIDRMVARARQEKVEELSELFGRDFEEMIENKDTIEGRIITHKFGDKNFYAQLVLSTTDTVDADDEDGDDEE